MVNTDPIADMLTRIRNAAMVRKNEVSMPHSKLKQTIAMVLANNNFIDGVEVIETSSVKILKITMKT